MTTDSSLQSINPSLSDIKDDDLVDIVEKMRKNIKILDVENTVFENFLRKVDPKLLFGMQLILEQADRIQGQLEQVQASISASQDLNLRLSKSVGSMSSTNSKFSQGSGPEGTRRINLTTRIELLAKERVAFLISMDEYYTNIKIKRDSLKAELEEINTRIAETKDAREIFEQSIVKDAVDPLTQRIPAEKFVRYMEEWLKSADSIIEKLRLRTCTLKYRRVFLQNQLKQKEELGETLHPVDLDQLKIDHRVLNKKLEQKNIDLLDLKKKSGEANLILSKNKIYLQSQTKALNSVTNEIKVKQKKLIELEREIKLVEKEVQISKEKLHNLENLIQKYTVPDLVDYIRQQNERYHLKQNIKIWKRRNNIQKSALDTCIKTMKRLTQRNTEDPTWFDPPQAKNEDDNYDYEYDDDS